MSKTKFIYEAYKCLSCGELCETLDSAKDHCGDPDLYFVCGQCNKAYWDEDLAKECCK